MMCKLLQSLVIASQGKIADAVEIRAERLHLLFAPRLQ